MSDIGSIEEKTQLYTNSSGTDRLMKALKKNQHFVLAQKNSTAIAMRSLVCWYDIFEQQLSSLSSLQSFVLLRYCEASQGATHGVDEGILVSCSNYIIPTSSSGCLRF